MDVVKSWNYDVSFTDSISTGQDTVYSSCPARLIRRVVHPLGLFDILVQIVELFDELRSNIRVIGKVVINQFLHQIVLDIGIPVNSH